MCLKYDISGGRQHRNTVPELGLRPAADVYCTTPVQLYIDYCFVEVNIKAICAYVHCMWLRREHIREGFGHCYAMTQIMIPITLLVCKT